MTAILDDFVIVVVRTRPRAIPLANDDNHEKVNSWVSFSFFYVDGAPLLKSHSGWGLIKSSPGQHCLTVVMRAASLISVIRNICCCRNCGNHTTTKGGNFHFCFTVCYE